MTKTWETIMKVLSRNTLAVLVALTAFPPAIHNAYGNDDKDNPLYHDEDVYRNAPKITLTDFAKGSRIYFERCAGCHGVLRKGATGKPLTPDLTIAKGTDYLKAFIGYGSPGGMPGFMTGGELTEEEVDIMARYVQQSPVAPPEMGLKGIEATWKLIVPVKDRPTKKMNNFNISNIFSTTLRDSGEVALIDGDTKEIITILKTGYAVHISRYSASGRYLYVTGRDAKINLIDLWMEKPAIVAEIKTGVEARSVETSKFKSWEDKYAISGPYWPPQFVIMEGDTLKPLKIVVTSGIASETNEYVKEARVAAIVASHFKPEFMVNVKETGNGDALRHVRSPGTDGVRRKRGRGVPGAFGDHPQENERSHHAEGRCRDSPHPGRTIRAGEDDPHRQPRQGRGDDGGPAGVRNQRRRPDRRHHGGPSE